MLTLMKLTLVFYCLNSIYTNSNQISRGKKPHRNGIVYDFRYSRKDGTRSDRNVDVGNLRGTQKQPLGGGDLLLFLRLVFLDFNKRCFPKNFASKRPPRKYTLHLADR